LETELLESFGFPIKGQDEYKTLVDLIKGTSNHWGMPPMPGGGNWWDENEKAKMDKFIYISLNNGFNACYKNPTISNEPDVIKNIKSVMGLNAVVGGNNLATENFITSNNTENL
jgi:hypothetical protein